MAWWNRLSNLFRRKERRDEKIVSFVLLLEKPIQLSPERVQKLTEWAWRVKFPRGRDATEFVVGNDGLPSTFIKCQHGTFLVNNFRKRYFDKDPSDQIAELRLSQAIAVHRAWVSVDRIGDEPNDAKAYQLIGKLTAAIAERIKTTPVVFWPETGRAVCYTPGVGEVLRSSDPRSAFSGCVGPVPVVSVSGDDPRMAEAVAEARRRWPEFLAAFEERSDEQNFAVKAGFGPDSEREVMWLTVTALENGRVFGCLGNEPMGDHGIKLGDIVRINESDIVDWIVSSPDCVQGAFSVRVLQAIEAERKQSR